MASPAKKWACRRNMCSDAFWRWLAKVQRKHHWNAGEQHSLPRYPDARVDRPLDFRWLGGFHIRFKIPFRHLVAPRASHWLPELSGRAAAISQVNALAELRHDRLYCCFSQNDRNP